MKREQIKALLTAAGLQEDKAKDLVDSIFTEHGKDIAAEQAKFAAKENELAAANKQIGDLNKTIESFGGQTPTELKTQLGNLQAKYDEDMASEKKKYEDLIKTQSLKDALTAAGVTDPDYVIYKQGGLDKFAFSDGKPVGIEDTLKPLREASPALFKAEPVKQGMRHEGGAQVKDNNNEHTEANNAIRALFGKE